MSPQKLYKETDEDSRKLAKLFKQTFSRTVSVDFVGVWDTVSSVGAIVSRHFPYATRNRTIKVFRQAISLDEHRVKVSVASQSSTGHGRCFT